MQSRWGWLLLSIALAETANLSMILVAWIRHRNEPNWRVVSAWTARLQRNSWVYLVRLLYAVGLPAFAYLTQGVLTARGLGLQSMTEGLTTRSAVIADWATDVGWALLIITIVWLVITVGRIQAGQTQSGFELGDGLPAFFEALYHQAHWAFYREPFVLALGPAAGSWVGAILAMSEALTNPGWWTDIHATRRKASIIGYGALLIASTALYGLTQNLWVAILAGGLLRWSLGLKPPTRVAGTRHSPATRRIKAPSMR